MKDFFKNFGMLQFLIKAFGPDGIFSNGTEGHAFLIGISEVVAFWRPRHDPPADYKADGNPFSEYHYYAFGRFCGIPTLLGMISLFVVSMILTIKLIIAF
jgi:hypothetical protein